MTSSDTGTWLDSVAPADLMDTTIQLHWAAQYIASAGQAFVEARDDDSHRTMTWHPGRRAFVGEPFTGGYPFQISLRPEDLTLHLIDQSGKELGSLPLAGQTREAGYSWLAAGLAHYMGGVPELARPEYDLPAHAVGEGAPFSEGREQELQALSALYGGAAALLEGIATSDERASTVRCWPHHFDIATLITLEEREEGQASKTVGVGMAPMGAGYDSWYWYVTPWPSPDAQALPALEGVGAWHTEGWVGAVLRGESVAEADAAFRGAVVRKFLDSAMRASMSSLRN